jgi:hypothetical protein
MGMTTPRRKYSPKGERSPSGAKSVIAAARPRDARGHFVPNVADRVADRDPVSGVVGPATYVGRGEPQAGDSVALNGPDGA